MVSELNYHKNLQRYIEFNFDPKNNYFRLKSEIFIKMGPKLEIWRFTQFDLSSSKFKPTEYYHFGKYYITWGMKTHLLHSKFSFFYKKKLVCLFSINIHSFNLKKPSFKDNLG